MQMRKFTNFISFFFCISLWSCTSGQGSFPDNINVQNIKQLKRVKGTKLFVSTPENYKPMESMVRMQRDNNTYLQVMEIPGSNFLETKNSFTKESFEKQGASVDIIKPVKYNGYDGIYFSGPSKTPGENKIGLAFGDTDFVVMLFGVCQSSDKKAIEELKKIFSSSYYDKSFNLDPLELASYKFDESITGFKLATTMGNMLAYTPNGKDDLKNSGNIMTSFQLSTIEAPSFSKAKDFLDNMISRYSGSEISNVAKHDTLINSNQAYEVTFQGIGPKDKAITYYQVVIYKTGTAVVFLSSDIDNGKWLDKFKKTGHSIQF
jgi:hypothetical protein